MENQNALPDKVQNCFRRDQQYQLGKLNNADKIFF